MNATQELSSDQRAGKRHVRVVALQLLSGNTQQQQGGGATGSPPGGRAGRRKREGDGEEEDADQQEQRGDGDRGGGGGGVLEVDVRDDVDCLVGPTGSHGCMALQVRGRREWFRPQWVAAVPGVG